MLESNEVSADVLRFLDRSNLDAPEITSRTVSNVIVACLDDFPLRIVVNLSIFDGGAVRFVSGKSNFQTLCIVYGF